MHSPITSQKSEPLYHTATLSSTDHKYSTDTDQLIIL